MWEDIPHIPHKEESMKNRGKKYIEAANKVEKHKAYTKEEAVKLVKETSISKFVSSVEISIYEDRSFDFVIKTPPTAFLLKKYAKIQKGSTKGSNETVATISDAQLTEIAEIKLPDLNAYTVEEAKKIVAGTAKNMGIAIEGQK